MILHNLDEGLVVEVASTNPSWELRVPDKVMAMDFFLVCFGPVAVAVGVGKGEVVTARLDDLPLHCILGGEGVEVGAVGGNGFFGGVATTGNLKSARQSKLSGRMINRLQSKCSADELPSTSLHGSGQTILGLGGRRVGDCRSSQRKSSEDLGETHLEAVVVEARVADESP